MANKKARGPEKSKTTTDNIVEMLKNKMMHPTLFDYLQFLPTIQGKINFQQSNQYSKVS